MQGCNSQDFPPPSLLPALPSSRRLLLPSPSPPPRPRARGPRPSHPERAGAGGPRRLSVDVRRGRAGGPGGRTAPPRRACPLAAHALSLPTSRGPSALRRRGGFGPRVPSPVCPYPGCAPASFPPERASQRRPPGFQNVRRERRSNSERGAQGQRVALRGGDPRAAEPPLLGTPQRGGWGWARSLPWDHWSGGSGVGAVGKEEKGPPETWYL